MKRRDFLKTAGSAAISTSILNNIVKAETSSVGKDSSVSKKQETLPAGQDLKFKGTIWGDSPKPLVAGSYSKYEVFYSPDIEGIAAGNKVKLYHSLQALPYEARLIRPQIDDPKLPGYVSAKRSDNGELKISMIAVRPEVGNADDARMIYGALEISVEIIGTPLKYGDFIIFKFGSEDNQVKGFPIQAFTFPQTQFLLWAFAEYTINQEKILFRVRDPAKFIVVADKLHRFLVNGSSESQKDKEMEFQIVSVDKYRNPVGYIGSLKYWFTLDGGEAFDSSVTNVELSPYQKATIKYVPKKEGILRIYVEASDICGIGFPIKVTAQEPKVRRYWGDIHVHSFLSDGYGSADESLYYARYILGHQFIAHTEHERGICRIDCNTGKTKWQIYLEAVEKIHETGIFTVILAYEISGRPPMNDGHRNMYVTADNLKLNVQGVDFKSTEELFEIARKEKALMFPHCVIAGDNHGTDFKGHDPEIERLVEIYSGWGCSEDVDSFESVVHIDPELGTGQTTYKNRVNPKRSVIYALDRGLHLGFAAGSDDHSGRASNVTWYEGKKVGNRGLNRRGGTTCVFAHENTRKDIFKNLYDRNCYAVTGENRMIIEFSVNGKSMGTINNDTSTERRIEFNVSAMDEVEKIDVIKNGKNLVSYEPKSLDFTNTFIDKEIGKSEDYYYIRVTTQQKDRGWSSPVWIRSISKT